MATRETPGVYVEEVPRLPPAVTEVATAISGFVGYTVKATSAAADDLRFKPTLVRSMADFVEFFGDSGASGAVAHLSDALGRPSIEKTAPPAFHPLYFALQLFFDNGGRQCYIVSVGMRSQTPALAELAQGVEALGQFDDVTLLVVPEARALAADDYATLVAAMLDQCAKQSDRFAIFDLYDGGNAHVDLEASRKLFPDDVRLSYGAAYYPDLLTTLTFPYTESVSPEGNVISNAFARINDGDPVDVASLRAKQPLYYDVAVAALRSHIVMLPPSAAVAGVYARSDLERGVWKAPANVALASVHMLTARLSQSEAERFNVDPSAGKSINTIRAMTEKGILVWGARTLAGNDAEWKYVPVRRFLMMLEESIGKSTQWVVFEPNDANTWVKARALVENYLTLKWREGALLGTTTKDAFFVRCGLGETMTAQDIADGRLIIEVGVAAVRPAEFIVFRISHQK